MAEFLCLTEPWAPGILGISVTTGLLEPQGELVGFRPRGSSYAEEPSQTRDGRNEDGNIPARSLLTLKSNPNQ